MMKRVLTILFTLTLLMFLAPQKASATEVPLYQYWNPYIGDHFYTININEIGACPTNGYTLERTVCNVFDGYQSGTTALYRYYNYQDGDHFYTTDWNELGYGANGWYFEKVECYVYPPDSESGIPLFQYWNGNGNVLDHFYTTDWNELGYGAYGWYFERDMCRVEPAD
jgi:hypothetical protein